MKSNLFLRVVSALVLAPIVLFAIFAGNPAFDILMACLGALMAWEWVHMITGKESYVSVVLTLMSSMVVFLGLILGASFGPPTVFPTTYPPISVAHTTNNNHKTYI